MRTTFTISALLILSTTTKACDCDSPVFQEKDAGGGLTIIPINWPNIYAADVKWTKFTHEGIDGIMYTAPFKPCKLNLEPHHAKKTYYTRVVAMM